MGPLNPGSCPFIVSDSPYPDGSFYYNGTGSSVADLKISEDNTYKKYGFTLWLKPTPSILTPGCNVSIFEYQSSSDPNQHTKVRAELISGSVRLTLSKAWGAIEVLTTAVSLTSSGFSSVLLSVDGDTSKMHITVNDTDKDQNVNTEYQLTVPGIWRVGDSWQTGTTRYRGKITCIAFFDDRVVHSDHSSEFGCSQSDLPSGVPNCAIQTEPQPGTNPNCGTTTALETTTSAEPDTTCLETTPVLMEALSTAMPTTHSQISSSPQTVLPSPLYLWPLDNITRGYEVISGASPVTPLKMLACLRTADHLAGTWNLSQPPLYLDGSWHSAVSLRVNASVFSNNFSVVVFVRSLQPWEGQVWSFTAFVCSNSSTLRMQVRLDSNGSVLFTVWKSGSASPCGLVKAPGALNNCSDVFTMVMVKKDAARLTVNVGGGVWTDAHSCTGHGVGCGDGSLRVGGRGDGVSAGFRGSVACLAVFSEVLHNAEEEHFLDQCENRYGSAFQAPVVDCEVQPEQRQRGFRLLAPNARPGMLITPAPMMSLPTASAVQCATACMQTEHCHAFTLSKPSQTLACHLYDFVTVTGLEESPGRHYYEVVSWSN